MKSKSECVIVVLAILPLLISCQSAAKIPVSTPVVVSTVAATATWTATPLPTVTPEPTLTVSPTATSTFTPTETASPSPSVTSTVTVSPTFAVLRGEVNQPHVNCYYGPSKAYLYKYGLIKGNRLDIIGFMPDTGYIEVQAIGGDNPCWMNAEFMDVQGDLVAVKPIDPEEITLPWSPYYPALAFAKAERSGTEVSVVWSPLKLKAGDDSEQESYLLEAWVCRAGRLTFVPVGVYTNQVKIMDEPGCLEPSHGRVYGVEKHGYTRYLMFDWPGFESRSED